MKRLALSLAALVVAFAVSSQAQMRGGFGAPTGNNPGIPASVTSMRPGNHNPGIPASVTSLHPSPLSGSTSFHHHHHNGSVPVFVPIYPYYGYESYPIGDYLLTNEDAYIPSYARPQPWDDTQNQQPPQPEAPAQTIFENRPGYQYQPAAPSVTASAQPAPTVQQQATEQQPSETQPETVLVFKDGHVMEIGNYVIVGSTLYNISGAYREFKIALADLDLDATVKANEDRGIEFHLPKKPA